MVDLGRAERVGFNGDACPQQICIEYLAGPEDTLGDN